MADNMMSYPHPVLGNRRDIQGQFNVSYSAFPDVEDVEIDYEFTLKHPEIEALIATNKARYCIQIECNNTFYRGGFLLKEPKGQIQIWSAALRDEVEIEFFITATEDISSYAPSGVSELYEGVEFDVEAGDVLAYGGSHSFSVTKNFDALRAPLNSIIDIRKGSEPKGPVRVNFDNSETLTIMLSHEDWANYEIAQRYMDASIHASIVFPALVDILYTMNDKGELYEDSMWFKKLVEMCRERRYNRDDPFETAQKFLAYPIKRAMNEYITSIGSEDGEL